MLAKNKSGWKLLEYIDIQEKDVEKYRNVTGEVPLVKDTTPQPTLTQYCKKTTFG